MNTISLIVTLIAQIVEIVLPKLASDTTTKLVDSIIAAFEAMLPDIIKAGGQLVVTTKNIIAALKGRDDITPDQWAQLDGFEKQIDADFDQAASDEGFAPETPPT